jgi:hypothetical protein
MKMQKLKVLLAFITGVLVTIVSFYIMENLNDFNQDYVTPNHENTILPKGDTKINSEKMFDDLFSKYKMKVDNYKKYKKGGVLRDEDKFTQAVWFNYDTLIDNLLRFRDSTFGDPAVNGVRVYFMMHEKKFTGRTEDPDNKEIGGKIDVFFTATKKTNNINRDVVEKNTFKFLVIGGSLLFNEGSLCPPPNSSCAGAVFLENN